MIRTSVFAGTAVGVLVSLLSFLGNHTPHTLYVFPDLTMVLVFVGAIIGGIGFVVRLHRLETRTSIWKGGMAVALSSGFVFGIGTAITGALLLSQSRTPVLVFGFAAVLLSSLMCGAIGSALWALLSSGQSQGDVHE